MPIYVLFDGGKNDDDGCYGSFMVLVGRELGVAELATHRVKEQYAKCRTHNEAEYTALLRALTWLLKKDTLPILPGFCHLVIIGDSKLVLEQLSGAWKVKARGLIPLYEKALDMISKFGEVVYSRDRDLIVERLGH